MGANLATLQQEVQNDLHAKIHSVQLQLNDSGDFPPVHRLSALETRELVLSGRLDLPTLVQLFHRRKVAEDNRHRCLTDVFFEQPLAQARAMQEQLKRPGAAAELPLLGFVLSVKDHVLMKGTRATCGILANFGTILDEPTPLIDYLRQKGALIMSKGNVPQLMMAMESKNNIFGETLNPLNHARTSGGSTGGDCAAVALGLANAAFGTDGAGSLRIPALFCGLTTLKVTAERFDNSCLAPLLHHQPDMDRLGDYVRVIPGVAGPAAKTVADLEAFLRVYAEFYKVLRWLPPVPWRPAQLPRRIGVFKELALFPPCETSRRAVRLCRDSFQRRGIELVEMDFNDQMEDLLVFCLSCFMKSRLLVELVARDHHMPEPICDMYHEYARAHRLPSIALRALQRFLPLRKRLVAQAILDAREKNLFYFQEKLARFKRFFQEAFDRAGVDVALFHALPPALLRGSSHRCTLLAMYCFVWNVVNFVAGALPITTVRPDEQHYDAPFQDSYTEAMRHNLGQSAGLPVGVQLIGRPFEEELVVEAMKALEQDHGSRGKLFEPLDQL